MSAMKPKEQLYDKQYLGNDNICIASFFLCLMSYCMEEMDIASIFEKSSPSF